MNGLTKIILGPYSSRQEVGNLRVKVFEISPNHALLCPDHALSKMGLTERTKHGLVFDKIVIPRVKARHVKYFILTSATLNCQVFKGKGEILV